MGYIKHDAIIVTSMDLSSIKRAKDRAESFFIDYFKDEDSTKLITETVKGLANGQYSFLIAPDGSKEGWSTSNLADQARADFMLWADKVSCIEYIHLKFGGDNSDNKILRSR